MTQQRILAYIDNQPQPIVKSFPSHIKDTNDDSLEKLINIPQPLSSDILLVSTDAGSLYTSIPHEDGIKLAEGLLTRDLTMTKQIKFF